MLIGNTILGLAKLARLMKFDGKKSQAKARANASHSIAALAEIATLRNHRKYFRSGKIKLNGKENPMPEWLSSIVAIGITNYIRVANSNAVTKSASQKAAKETAHNNSFSARVNAHKAEDHTVVR